MAIRNVCALKTRKIPSSIPVTLFRHKPLIPRFDNTQPLYAAVSQGHHVLVLLGADDNFNQDIIDLPRIDGRGQISSLVKSGFSQEEAEKFSCYQKTNMHRFRKIVMYDSESKLH